MPPEKEAFLFDLEKRERRPNARLCSGLFADFFEARSNRRIHFFE